MGKLITALSLALLLSACGTIQPVVKYVPTEPVKVEAPQRPRLAIQDLDGAATDEQKDKALAASLWQLMGYSKQLEALLAPYTKKVEPETK